MVASTKLACLTRISEYDAYLEKSPLFLEGPGLGAPAAWFLGPKAENQDILVELITDAITEHCNFRREYQPDDPEIITDRTRNTEEYKAAVENLRKHARDLSRMLKKSAPTFSMRSHGHMLWDQVLPGMVGYFAGMLYNQNNVAAEASPITTWLEIQVGNDLCRMLGYKVPPKGTTPPEGTIVPWGHITCDGSVANIEALWAVRNAKFIAIAIKNALKNDGLLAPARNIEVNLLDGSSARLIDLDHWTLLNLKIDDVVTLPKRMSEMAPQGELSAQQVMTAVRHYSVAHIGLVDFYLNHMGESRNTPVALVPATRHYSWPKAATILGLGQKNLIKVYVDLRARMDMVELEARLQHCLNEKIPVLAVVAVIGSTEESAVDPLRSILDLREKFRLQGLDFAVHCDAAWGGYFNSIYRDSDDALDTLESFEFAGDAAPEFPMSDYVAEQYKALGEADCITVDPHKAGFVPYPAGGLCYRNSALRDLISLKAPVIFHSQSEPTVGIYGIEGSKPGAAAAATYLAHKVIRPTRDGYGKILGQCIWTSKRMYCRLLTMADRIPEDQNPFKIEIFQMLPGELNGSDPKVINEQREIISSFVDLDNDALQARLESDNKAMELFKEIGSDQVILAFAFNFRDPETGNWNTDIDKLNELNSLIYKLSSISRPDQNPNDVELILTGSEFDAKNYGASFLKHFGDRLGVENPNDRNISFLISTTMNPWTTDTTKGDFLEIVEEALKMNVSNAIDEVISEPTPDPDEVVIVNEPNYHAFAVLGNDRIFLSHLTMLDPRMEIHRYQFVLEVDLPDSVMKKYQQERKAHPQDSYFIANTMKDDQVGNSTSDPMTVPALQSGNRKSFIGNLFRGIPNKDEYKSWPWAGVIPVIENFTITIKRVVVFRPFTDNMEYPSTLTYHLFGAGNEAHMVHAQTKEPDYDHVLSLEAAPNWLSPELLEAGILVDLPDLLRIPKENSESADVRCKNPIASGEDISVRYRGSGDPLIVTPAQTYWFCTRVANVPDPCKHCIRPCGSATPEQYLADNSHNSPGSALPDNSVQKGT